MRSIALFCLLVLLLPQPAAAQDVFVLPGYEESIEWLESIEWWGEERRGEQLEASRTLLVAISPRWRDEAPLSPRIRYGYPRAAEI